MTSENRYVRLIERLFLDRHQPGLKTVEFLRTDIESLAQTLRLELPRNLGDLIYTFRYRTALPDSISRTAPPGSVWVIRSTGRAKYCFSLTTQANIAPNPALLKIKIPDATPGVVASYALGDEQALLAKLRYNRLIDVFTGVVCYSLQNHLRTTVKSIGQVETDEIYVGVDRQGAHYVLPVQAKGGRDKISVVQIEQDLAMCGEKFPQLICRAIGA